MSKNQDRDALNNGPLGSTLAVHAGEQRQKYGDSITDPIFCAATYTFANTDAVVEYVDGGLPREEYGRYGNPGEKVAEKKLATLEGGEAAILFSTGMAAVVGLLTAKLAAGDEVILFDECYHRTREFCVKYLSRFNITVRLVPASDYDAIEGAITSRTKLLMSESPTNPHLSVVDVERLAEIGKRHEVETLIDATLATPFNLRPLKVGIDYVVHSATKYLGGHNDLLAGVIVSREELLAPIRDVRGVTGAISGPHSIYLLLRGLKTFGLRMARHNENGQRIAEFLAGHPRIERVLYPGLECHPHHDVAKRTMHGFGGLVTFLVKDADWRATADVVDAVTIPRIGPSLGGVESLIEQPLVMSYHQCTPAQRRDFGISENMIRLACGIEDTQDLIADLQQALDRSGG